MPQPDSPHRTPKRKSRSVTVARHSRKLASRCKRANTFASSKPNGRRNLMAVCSTSAPGAPSLRGTVRYATTSAATKTSPVMRQKAVQYQLGSSGGIGRRSLGRSPRILDRTGGLKNRTRSTSRSRSLVTQFLPRRTSASHSTKLTAFSVRSLIDSNEDTTPPRTRYRLERPIYATPGSVVYPDAWGDLSAGRRARARSPGVVRVTPSPARFGTGSTSGLSL